MSDVTPPSRRTQWLRWGAGGAAAVLAAGGGLWFLSPAGGIDRPVHLERQADGTLGDGAVEGGGLSFAASAGALKSNSSRSTVSSTSSSEPSWFRGRTLSIINRSDHLLLNRVGEALLETLKQEPDFDQIDYFPFGHRPAHGALAPDLIVTLDLASIDESGLVGRDLKANVSMTAGTSYAASNHSVTTTYTPPFLQSRSQTMLEHESSLLGVESAGARYSMQGKDIGQDLGKQLIGELKKLREEHAAPPELPASMVGEFHETPEFKFVAELGAQVLSSVHDVMIHNETFWQLAQPTDAVAALTQIHQELTEAGWKGSNNEIQDQSPRLAMSKGDQAIECFVEGAGTYLSSDGKDPRKAKPVIVRYTESMARPGMISWFDELLNAPQPDVGLLLDLRRFGESDQQQRVLDLAKENPPRTATAWLALSEHYERSGDRDGAVRALQCAQACLQLEPQSKHDSTVQSRAKKLEVKPEELKVIDASIWDALGIPRLTEAEPTASVEFGSGDAGVFQLGDGDDWIVVGVRVKPASPGKYHLTTFESHADSLRSWGTMSDVSIETARQQSFHLDGQKVEVELEQIAPGQFRATAKLSP
jgi:hypothetical protein